MQARNVPVTYINDEQVLVHATEFSVDEAGILSLQLSLSSDVGLVEIKSPAVRRTDDGRDNVSVRVFGSRPLKIHPVSFWTVRSESISLSLIGRSASQ